MTSHGRSARSASLDVVLSLSGLHSFEPFRLPLFDDNISSLFLLEGISPNIHLLCKLAVSPLAAIFVVFCVNLVLMVCLICSAL